MSRSYFLQDRCEHSVTIADRQLGSAVVAYQVHNVARGRKNLFTTGTRRKVFESRSLGLLVEQSFHEIGELFRE